MTALLLALALPAGAGASPYLRNGIQDDAWLRYGPGTLDERLDQLEELGVDLVRLNVLWPEVQPRRGRFDWSGYDPVVRGLHRHGIEPVLTLFATPAWANGGRGQNVAPRSGAAFARFAAATARRYPFVRRFLVWNEPNQRRWLRPTKPATYVRKLLNPAYRAIHRVRPRALVAGGVTAPRAGRGGVSPVTWIRAMGRLHARLDAYAHNPYPLRRGETPFDGGCGHCRTITISTLGRLLGNVRRSLGARTRIWLTELGYQTDPPDRRLGVSYAKQARYLGQAALRAYLAPRVDILVHYLVQDEPRIARWQSGLQTVRGVPKLAYAAYSTPVAIRSRKGRRVVLWAQIRDGHGRRRYRLERRRGRGPWHPVGRARVTNRHGYLTRVVRARTGTRLRVVPLPRRGTASIPVVVRRG